jgi:hypothetical protein
VYYETGSSSKGMGRSDWLLVLAVREPLLIIVIAPSDVGLSAAQGLRIEFAVIDSVTYASNKGCRSDEPRLEMG